MDLILYIVFGLIAVAANWLQKRREGEKETSWEEVEGKPPQPKPTASLGESRPQTTASAPKKSISWEEELRRLLEGQTAPKQEPRQEQLPPVPKPAQRQPQSQATLPLPRPKQSAPPPVPVAASSKKSVQKGTSVAEARKEAERLRAQADAYLSGHERKRRPKTPVRAHAISMLRHPRSARQAIIASVIIAPPKALEPAQ